MIFLDGLGRLLFPPKCVLCGKLLEKRETDLCHSCRVDQPEWNAKGKKFPFIDSFVAIWYYEGPARSSILRYKFHGRRSYAQCYGRLLAMKLSEEYPEEFDVITWVPTASLRKFRRGYDQAQLIAEAVSSELGARSIKLLKKVRNNRPQSGITGQAERRANVLGAYRVMDKQIVAGKRILLIDDVITTGATVGEAARILLTAGAKQVCCGAVAVARRDGKISR